MIAGKRAGMRPISSVSDGVYGPRLGEGAQPQGARVAAPARALLRLVARPRESQRRAEREAAADDLGLAEVDDGRPDLDARRGLRADIDGALESLVELGPAVGVAGRVLGHGADVDAPRADDLGPTRRRREQVRVAEGDVARRYLARREVGF